MLFRALAYVYLLGRSEALQILMFAAVQRLDPQPDGSLVANTDIVACGQLL
jgi:hypothetical protein